MEKYRLTVWCEDVFLEVRWVAMKGFKSCAARAREACWAKVMDISGLNNCTNHKIGIQMSGQIHHCLGAAFEVVDSLLNRPIESLFVRR